MSEAVFEIGGYRQVSSLDDCFGVGESFFATYGAFAVATPEGEGQTAAGSGQGLETQRLENASAACVPRVRDYEGARTRVQGLESLSFFRLHSFYMLADFYLLVATPN